VPQANNGVFLDEREGVREEPAISCYAQKFGAEILNTTKRYFQEYKLIYTASHIKYNIRLYRIYAADVLPDFRNKLKLIRRKGGMSKERHLRW